MICHTPPLENTQPQSYPIPKFYIFKWDGTEAGLWHFSFLRLGMAFLLASLLFEWWSNDRPSLNPLYFSRENCLHSCLTLDLGL